MRLGNRLQKVRSCYPVAFARERPSLGNPYLDLRDQHLRSESPLQLGGIRALEEQAQRLDEVVTRCFDRGALGGDVILRAERGVATLLPFNNRGESSQVSPATEF